MRIQRTSSKRLMVAAFAAAAFLAIGFVTRGMWLPALGRSTVCHASEAGADAILIDNISPELALFKEARRLQQLGLAKDVFVPVNTAAGDKDAAAVAFGVASIMCEVAGLANCTTFSVSTEEPFSLNFARRTVAPLQARSVRSVLLVSEGFRSVRAETVYKKVLGSHGIDVRCRPAFNDRSPDNWFRTTHGIQHVLLQVGKLIYYRVSVLPGAD